MEMTRENQLAAIESGKKRLGITQHRLEILSNVKVGTIKDLKRGKTAILRADKWQKISRVLGDEQIHLVPVLGIVGAGAEVFPIDDHAKGAALEEVEAPIGYAPENIIALRVRGDSMEPAIEDGDLIFYKRETDGVPSECIGKKCIVKMENDGILVKRVMKGSKAGHYHLMSINKKNDPLIDVKLVWASRVIDIRPS